MECIVGRRRVCLSSSRKQAGKTRSRLDDAGDGFRLLAQRSRFRHGKDSFAALERVVLVLGVTSDCKRCLHDFTRNVAGFHAANITPEQRLKNQKP